MFKIQTSESEITKYFKDFFNELKSQDVVLLHGPIGAGKTTFVRQFVQHHLTSLANDDLGAVDVAGGGQSPSYNLIHEYLFKNFKVIHIDLYRIENEDDLESTGFWDVMQTKNAIFFIEWPEKLDRNELQAKRVFDLKIEISKDLRIYTLDPYKFPYGSDKKL